VPHIQWVRHSEGYSYYYGHDTGRVWFVRVHDQLYAYRDIPR